MYISEENYKKLKEYIDNLYWDQDRMSSSGKYYLDTLDEFVSSFKNNNKVYVITDNAVVDDEIINNVYGVAVSKNEANKIFNQAVKDAKCDFEFDVVNPINIDDYNHNCDGEWIYDENEKSFEMWLEGEYNSNNINIELLELELTNNLENEKEEEYGL